MIAFPKSRLPNGLDSDALACACARLFARVRVGPASGFRVKAPGAGWLAVADHAVLLAAASEDGPVHLSIAELASQLRKAYARGMKAVGTETRYEEVPPLIRIAWESVARLTVWATQAGRADLAGGLTQAVAYRVKMADSQLVDRGIDRG